VIAQRFHVDDCILACAGCGSRLVENVMQHPGDCPELRQGGDPGPLPLPAQVFAWLERHGWSMIGTGEGGSAWTPPVGAWKGWVGIPDAGSAPELAGALERIAKRSGLPFGEVLAGMRGEPGA
jgi:hypothetical protein